MFWVAIGTIICSVTVMALLGLRQRNDQRGSDAARQKYLEETLKRTSVQKYLWSVANDVTTSLVAHKEPGAELLRSRLQRWKVSLLNLDRGLEEISAGCICHQRLHALVADAYGEQRKFEDMQRSLLIARKQTPRGKMPSLIDIDIYIDPISNPDESGTTTRRSIQARSSGVNQPANPADSAVA